ncbi:COPI associated [Conidiobolus coronatus NRRL 28638]|uniref:COPI associated n=1 Tax=Conidiobolus coronatus (strain ATCC 28846 / CBS 209.66 / NRRL 28638) TaxID=796925 RepID=A0A137P423_CONC2|nr:COPI associated [Conidiobolus coronatus NRRL 28638]|eukprot:KXN69755.1 COPI associated [Conidiobolus coronatus NRRL 28638]
MAIPLIIFRVLNIIVGILLIIVGVVRCIEISFSNIILGIYAIVFGLVIAALEFHIPEPISKYCNFLLVPIGRGFFYIFTCALVLGGYWYQYVTTIILFVLGIIYIALSFVAPQPITMGAAGGTSSVV